MFADLSSSKITKTRALFFFFIFHLILTTASSQRLDVINNGVHFPSGTGKYFFVGGEDRNAGAMALAQGGVFSVIDFNDVLLIRRRSDDAIHLRINASNGYVGIGRTPSYKLDVNGSMRVNSITYSSDLRLKQNIENFSKIPVIPKLMKLNALKYDRIQSSTETSRDDKLPQPNYSITPKKNKNSY